MELFAALPDRAQAVIYIAIGLALLYGALFILGHILFKGDEAWRTLFVLGGFVAGGIAASLYLDNQPILPATIVAKNEQVYINRIIFGSDVSWDNQFELTAKFIPDGESQPVEAVLSAQGAQFDGFAVGEAIEIKHWRAGGALELARLSNRSTFSLLLGSSMWRAVLLIALGVGLAWAASAIRKDVTAGLFVAAIYIVFILGGTIASQWLKAAPIRGASKPTTGTVIQVTHRSQTFSARPRTRMKLLQPIEFWEVEFTPPEVGDKVRGVDVIDAGILQGEYGDQINFVYDPDNPRRIQLVDGRRLYAVKNGISPTGTPLLIFAIAAWFFRPGKKWRSDSKKREGDREANQAAKR